MADNPLSGLKNMKPWQKYAVIGGGAIAVYYVYYKHKQSSSSSAANSGSSIDPVTGLPYSQDNTVDPLTGETYLQEAQQYGSVSAAESAVSSGASSGYGGGYGAYNAYGDQYGYNSAGNVPYSSFTGYQTGSNYTSNAEWAQAATAGLTDLGYSSTDIAAALGNYLAGLPLTSGQQQIVAAADAEYGYPPAGVPPVTTAPQTPPAQTGNNPPTPTPAPTPTPKPQQISPVAWVREQWANPTATNVHWAPSEGAKEYQVRVTYQSKLIQTHMTTGENYTITGLSPNRTYGVHVVAISGSDWASPETSTTVHTPQ